MSRNPHQIRRFDNVSAAELPANHLELMPHRECSRQQVVIWQIKQTSSGQLSKVHRKICVSRELNEATVWRNTTRRNLEKRRLPRAVSTQQNTQLASYRTQ
jgi:hypothetical protein